MRARKTATESATPAQVALARMLETAFDDDDLATRCLKRALDAAGLAAVPERVDDVLSFGHAHVVPILADELGPRLAAALFEDLESDVSRLRRSDVRIAMPRVLERATSTPRMPLPTIHSPPPRDSLPAARAVLALVEGDRWTRAPIARALVQSGFDVLPLDSVTAALDALRRDPQPIDVLVAEVDGDACAALLRAAHERHRGIRVLAWTRSEPDRAAEAIAREGIARFAIVARASSAAQVAEAARRLVRV